jgi:dihydrofolate reductase
MPVILIAAVAGRNLVIGKDGDLPWHFSADLKFFKQTTMGQAVLMGRITYQSILKRLGKPLPGRRTFVLTGDANFSDDRVTVLHGLATLNSLTADNESLFVIGGARVYGQTISRAEQLLVTHIDQEIVGDAFFPAIDPAIWQKQQERHEIEKGTTLRFCTYRRRQPLEK